MEEVSAREPGHLAAQLVRFQADAALAIGWVTKVVRSHSDSGDCFHGLGRCWGRTGALLLLPWPSHRDDVLSEILHHTLEHREDSVAAAGTVGLLLVLLLLCIRQRCRSWRSWGPAFLLSSRIVVVQGGLLLRHEYALHDLIHRGGEDLISRGWMARRGTEGQEGSQRGSLRRQRLR